MDQKVTKTDRRIPGSITPKQRETILKLITSISRTIYDEEDDKDLFLNLSYLSSTQAGLLIKMLYALSEAARIYRGTKDEEIRKLVNEYVSFNPPTRGPILKKSDLIVVVHPKSPSPPHLRG